MHLWSKYVLLCVHRVRYTCGPSSSRCVPTLSHSVPPDLTRGVHAENTAKSPTRREACDCCKWQHTEVTCSFCSTCHGIGASGHVHVLLTILCQSWASDVQWVLLGLWLQGLDHSVHTVGVSQDPPWPLWGVAGRQREMLGLWRHSSPCECWFMLLSLNYIK